MVRLGACLGSIFPERNRLRHGFCGRRFQAIAALRKEQLEIGAAIVGVGPGAGLPGGAAERKSNFGIDPLPQIQSMGVILGRGQDELGEGDVAGIEIERALFGMVAEGGVVGFPPVRLQL